jgi:hypothetical protein
MWTGSAAQWSSSMPGFVVAPARSREVAPVGMRPVVHETLLERLQLVRDGLASITGR